MSQMNDNLIDSRAYQACEVLNRALEADPKAMHQLLSISIQCNERLGEDPTIICQITEDDQLALGVLGLINGVLGNRSDGKGPLCGIVDKDTGAIVRFDVTPYQDTA